MDPASPQVGARPAAARATSSGVFAADRFRLEAHLSSDPLGEVWRARDARGGRAVAVRLLPEWLLPDADAAASFARKARSLQALQHPGIVRVLAADPQSVPAVLATELPKGTPLEASLPARGVPAGQVAAMLAPVAEALAAAHAANVVHGDLRPANILVGRQPRIVGFGLATFASRHGQPPAGLVIGDPEYWSPEQAHGRPLTRAADIFALGKLIDRLVSRDTRADLATLIAAMTSRGVRARPASSDVADELREIARRDSAPAAAPARVVQFRPRPPALPEAVPPPVWRAAPPPEPVRFVPTIALPPAESARANGVHAPAGNGNGNGNGAAAAVTAPTPPRKPAPAPAPAAAVPGAPAAPAGRGGARRGLIAAAVAVPLLAAGAYVAVRATSGGTAKPSAAAAAPSTPAPSASTPTVATPAAATPAIPLTAFPGAHVPVGIPSGWQAVWADLNHQGSFANVATGPGDARVDCEAPARPGARAATAALAGARDGHPRAAGPARACRVDDHRRRRYREPVRVRLHGRDRRDAGPRARRADRDGRRRRRLGDRGRDARRRPEGAGRRDHRLVPAGAMSVGQRGQEGR